MNKNKKKIIFSSVSVILILTLICGTFAWFYLNEKVAVNYGNSIFCEAGDSLEIALVKNGVASGWSSSIDYSAGEFTTLDITGDGYNLFRPLEINELQQPVGFERAKSSLDSDNDFDYVDIELSFRSLSKMDVFFSGESFVRPVNTENNGKNIYGDFSRDYIAGAVRVAVVEGSDVKMIWAPNSKYELIKEDGGKYSFKSGDEGDSVAESHYSYYNEDSNGNLAEKIVTKDDYADKKFIIDSTGATNDFSGNSPVLVSLNPRSEGEFAQKTVKIRIWFEGTDREADQALAGGNVDVKLKFAGINKEPAESKKVDDMRNVSFNQQTSTFSGLKDGMVFSTDGYTWNAYTASTPNTPVLKTGESIYIKYPETATNFDTNYKKFTKID